MMPHRYVGRQVTRLWRWLAGHQMVAFLLILVIVAVPGYLRLQHVADDANSAAVDANAAAAQATDLAQCAQDYAKRTNEANAPVREANTLLNAADDAVWAAANVIFTQKATSADYDALRDAVHARKLLSDHLKLVKLRHPPPPPPETFCAVTDQGDVIKPSAYSIPRTTVIAAPVFLSVGEGGDCATHVEWNGLETFMRAGTVADLLGTSGVSLGENPAVFRRGYDVCWDATQIGVVRYDQQSGYSISWIVRVR